MGVLGLWQLLQPSARTAKIEGLEGKVLAIATRGAKNSPNGHISVLYNRICKLLYYKVKPIFVFDGPNVPNLKQRVLQERRNRHVAAVSKNKTLENRIKQNLLNSQSQDSSQRQSKRTNDEAIDDLFVLPEKQPDLDLEVKDSAESTESETSGEETSPFASTESGSNLDFDDLDKEVFESLPDDLKLEIMSEYRTRLKEKKSSLCELPRNSQDFSDYQLKLLFKKGQLLNQMRDIKKSISSSYSAGTQYDEVYHERVASNVDHEVLLFKKKTSSSSIFAIGGKTSSSENTQDEESWNLTEQTHITEPKKKEAEISVLAGENVSASKIVDTVVETQPNTDEQIREIEMPKFTRNDDIIDLEKPNTQGEGLTKVVEAVKVIETSNLKESQNVMPTESNISKSQNEVIPIEEIETDSEEDDFVEVESRPPPPAKSSVDEDMIMLNEVRQKLKESGGVVDRRRSQTSESNDTTEIQRINEALGNNSDIEIIEGDTEVAAVSTANTSDDRELFNEVAFLVRQQQQPATTDYSAISYNRIDAHVVEDAKHLLRLFGLPYVESPGEAEAQCAYFDCSNITDGSITEDSDTWLFGGKRVYKSFFGSEPCIDVFTIDAIKSLLGLDRFDLINIALLVGSDYTLGLENVGIVKAVEILNEFEGDAIEKLKNFKDWHAKQKEKRDSNLSKIRKALVKLNIPESFPSEIVFRAYTNPNVEKSNREFTWTLPDLDLLRKYMVNKLGWTIKKVNDDLIPIIKRIQDKMVQKTIENFFLYDRLPTFSKQSKRMKSAIEKLKTNICSKASSTIKQRGGGGDDIVLSEDDDDDDDDDGQEVESNENSGSDDYERPRTSKARKKKTSDVDFNLANAKKTKRSNTNKKKTTKKK